MTSHIKTRVTYFNSIPVIPEEKSILSRLGYHRRLTALSVKDLTFISEISSLGLALCRNQGATGRFAIKARTVETITLADGDCLESRQLSKLLQKSDEVLFMAGTAGTEITERISREMEEGNAAAAVILDAVASVSADIILDWIMETFNKTLRREGRQLTGHRYSPGFGDLPLCNQAVIFRLLSLERLNLCLTESMMLVPEKSVLAIAGIERIKAN